MRPALPPGPRLPAALQTIGWWSRPRAYLERCRERYGKRFTLRLLATPPFVILSDPADIEAVLKAPPDVLHPGEGARILEPLVGSHSLILLDEGPHLEQRKLLLPAFHGERMEALRGLVEEVTVRDVESWPRGEPVALHARLQSLTLEIILRAVFGLTPGERLDGLRRSLTDLLDLSTRPSSLLPPVRRSFGGHGPWARFSALRREADAMIFELIEERRADEGDGEDILAMLLAARHEDGSAMSAQELRDELMTLLTAGHETTASELAWAFERLVREPRALARLTDEVRAGDGDAYLTATIQETLRRRPVLPNAEPRLTKRPVEIEGWTYPEEVSLIVNAYLVHHDPEIYPDPYAFRPERFLDEPPGTYTWLPFGGGRRRCIGASFATLEMKVVLASVLEVADLRPARDGLELARRRSITAAGGHPDTRGDGFAGKACARVAVGSGGGLGRDRIAELQGAPRERRHGERAAHPR
jgi:cytochrome P450